MGDLIITREQAQRLSVPPYSQLSTHLQNCCLILSANVSYQRATQDLKYITSIQVSATTQQRLVHRCHFCNPEIKTELKEVSVDGGKVRLRTKLGEPCRWKDSKAIVTEQGLIADYQNNQGLIDWLNEQSLAEPITCLGDGHDGIWNMIKQIGLPQKRREILDWYHLVENLSKVDGSKKRRKRAQELLWSGRVEETISLFEGVKSKKAKNFCLYLKKHKKRIVNYGYYQEEQICSIGSGAVESGIKQISRRIKISGAQWKEENVSQVLAHRSAYLNCLIGAQR